MGNEKERLQDFIRDWLNNEWNTAEQSSEDIMESMGWKSFKIDVDKFYEFMKKTVMQNVDNIVSTMIYEAKSVNKKLTEDDILELLLWHLTGDITKAYLLKYNQLADRLASILSDNSANWIAEGFSTSKNV